MRLSPLDSMAYRSDAALAWAHFFRGQFDDAIVWADRAVREQPHFLPPLRIKLAAAAMADRHDEAADALLKLRAAQPDVSIRTLMQMHSSRLPSSATFMKPHCAKPAFPDSHREKNPRKGEQFFGGLPKRTRGPSRVVPTDRRFTTWRRASGRAS